MHFTLEHYFEAPVDVVERASNADDYQERLSDLPNLGARKVTKLERHPDGSIDRTTHCKLGSQLPAPVVAVIGPAATWDEVATFDPATHRWPFEIRPHVLGGRIDCKGQYTFEPDGNGHGTKRVVAVDLKVKVPLVGGRVEREIGKGLKETMDAEARILSEYLAESER